MHTIRIHDTYCTVYNETTHTDLYTLYYEEYGGSVEAFEEAERMCEEINGKDER